MKKAVYILAIIIILDIFLVTACGSSAYPFNADGYVKFNVVRVDGGAEASWLLYESGSFAYSHFCYSGYFSLCICKNKSC